MESNRSPVTSLPGVLCERTKRLFEIVLSVAGENEVLFLPHGTLITINFPEGLRMHIGYQDNMIYIPNNPDPKYRLVAERLVELYKEELKEYFDIA